MPSNNIRWLSVSLIHVFYPSFFLLYVSVMLIITFLQQEFVLLPELQNLDIVGEEARAVLLEKWSRWRWVAFLLPPVLLLIRLSLISLCLFIGSFFFSDMVGKKFKDWWGVTTFARLMLCSRQNAHRILKKKALDTDLLMRISEILEHDFFRDISESRYSGTMDDKI